MEERKGSGIRGGSEWWGIRALHHDFTPPNLIGQAVSFREGIVYRWNVDGCFRFFGTSEHAPWKIRQKQNEFLESSKECSNNYVPRTIKKKFVSGIAPISDWPPWITKHTGVNLRKNLSYQPMAFAPWWHSQHHSKPMINENVVKKVQTANLSNSNFIGISLRKS